MSVLPQPRGEPIVSPNAISALANYVNNDTPEWALAGSGGGGGGQVLSQSGNSVFLSGGGGSVDIASTTSVASSATKTTAITYNGGLLSTSIVGDLFVERTEVGTPLTPQPLTVNGTLDVVIDPTGFVRLTNLGSVLPAGQNVLYIDPILGTVGQGGAPASTWVGTATSDLNMNGYNITTPNNLTIATNTGTVTVSNPVVGIGGAQLNVNGSASIRGNTAQLQILDNAGVQKGSLSYNAIDGQTHLDGTDLAVSSSTNINVTSQADLSLYSETGNVTITAHEASIALDSHTDIGISCNNGGTITVGGANTSTVNISVVDNVGMSSSGGGTFTANFETVSISAVGATLGLSSLQDMTISSSTGTVGISAGNEMYLTADTSVYVTSTNGNIELTTTAGTGNDIKLVAENGVFIQAQNALLDIEGANAVKVQSGGILDLIGQSGDVSIQLGSAGACTVSATDVITATAGGDISLTAGASASLTTTSGGIELHSNGGNLVLASSADGVSISSGGGDSVSITGGGGGINCSTTSGGNIGLTSGGNIGLTSVDNMTVTSGADLSLSSTNPTGIAQIATANTSVSLDEATQSITLTAGGGGFIVQNGGNEHFRVSSSSVTITDVPLGLNAQNITGVNNVRYEHSYRTTGVTLTANSQAIQTFNGVGLTATLPLVDATNVGRQFIITNIAVVGLTVASSGLQLIYYNVGSASATTRTLGPGHSQILTAIRTGVSTYGWSMV